MTKRIVRLSITTCAMLALAANASAQPTPAFEGAEGFGAVARGGAGGRTIMVTRLDDDASSPAEGTLRWAVQQKGPRIVRFAAAGTIRLADTLTITEPFITIDGSDAPGDGVCVRDYSMHLKNTHDVIVRHLRIRRGDVNVLADVRAKGLDRPRGSTGLDCVSIDDSRAVIFDHCSLSWSCDEVFGIVRSRDVTVQWCLIAEPLSNPMVHPYGNNHAFGLNCSASRLSVHHNLIAHYVMRGPQLEANDVDQRTDYDVQMEAVNNVLFDYARSGSRYTTGIESHPERAAGRRFMFHFIANRYLPGGSQPEIEAELKHGVADPVRVFVRGNIGPNRASPEMDEWAALFAGRTPMRQADAAVRAQVAADPLFTPPVPVTLHTADEAMRLVLKRAGSGPRRDAVDRRIIDNVRAMRTGRIVHSQDDVGGWPELK